MGEIMSVFRVKLNSDVQGLLDKHPTTGDQMTTSYQRQVYVMGPNKVNRLLSDGEQFTDCNYWKKFAPYSTSNPMGCDTVNAFIEIVTDDGSVYSDIPGENTYPRVYTLVVEAGSAFTTNVADILGDTGGYAVFAQLTNSHTTQAVSVRLNGSTDAVFTLSAAEVQIFNAGDLAISKIEIANNESGADGPVTVEILLSVKSICNS